MKKRRLFGKLVPKKIRNYGYSAGLEYPYIFGKDWTGTDRWIVWHRHTGLIVAVMDESNPVSNRYRASEHSDALNKLPPMTAEMAALLDSTP